MAEVHDFEAANRRVLEALVEIENKVRGIREAILLEMARGPITPEDIPRRQFDELRSHVEREGLEVLFNRRRGDRGGPGDTGGSRPRIPP